MELLTKAVEEPLCALAALKSAALSAMASKIFRYVTKTDS